MHVTKFLSLQLLTLIFFDQQHNKLTQYKFIYNYNFVAIFYTPNVLLKTKENNSFKIFSTSNCLWYDRYRSYCSEQIDMCVYIKKCNDHFWHKFLSCFCEQKSRRNILQKILKFFKLQLLFGSEHGFCCLFTSISSSAESSYNKN